MRKRSPLMIFASLLVLSACIDTAEPTGPPQPAPEDGGGEFAPAAVGTDAAAAQRRGTQRN